MLILKQSPNYLCNIVDESIWGSGKQILVFAQLQSVLIDLGPKIPLLPSTFEHCSLICCFQFRLSSMRTPRYFMWCDCLIGLLSINSLSLGLFCFVVTTINSVLLKFIDNLFNLNQLLTLTNSLLIFCCSVETLEWERVRFVSSAKRWIVEFEASKRWLI